MTADHRVQTSDHRLGTKDLGTPAELPQRQDTLQLVPVRLDAPDSVDSVAVGGWCRHTVDTDARGMLEAGVEQLVAQDCRKLALLAWGHTADSFESCLAAHGLEFHHQWCRHNLEPSLPGAGWEEFREIWAASPEKPDGMLILDDVLADDAARAISELRLQVREQLRLVVHAYLL